MRTIAGWHIEMEFLEDECHTRSAARLTLGDGTVFSAQGHAKRHPSDPEQRLVGEEIAAARALTDLAHRLLEKAGGEITQVTHEDAHLMR
jgi:Domain of unknown function (DUF1876)